MSAGHFIPSSFGREVRKQRRRLLGHPRPRVGPDHAVFGVLERDLPGHRRRVWTHVGQRTAARLLVACIAGLAALLPGLAVPTSAHAADNDTTFTVALIADVDSFNPFLGFVAEAYEMWGLTYDYMINYSMKDVSPQPGLATDWSTSDDGLTWTFDIRTGVKWSDGQPLTAADIAYTYNRVLHGTTEGQNWLSYLTGVTKVTSPDATHVVLQLKKPNAVLPLLPIPIVPEHIWKNVSEKAIKSYAAEPKGGQPVVGSGPFRLVEGTAGGPSYRFDANPDYWKGAPNVDHVVFKVYKSADPAIQALIKGEVDFVEGITPVQVTALQGKPGITAHNGDSPGFDEIAFNTGSIDTKTGKPMGDPNPAVLDPKFRHALGYALDLDQIVKKVYQGGGLPGDTIIPPAYTAWKWTPPADEAFTFDLDKAGQLLDAAGYKLGSDGKRTMPDGSPIGTLRLAARSDSPTSLDTMTFFKEWLGELGIDSKVQALESSKLTGVILDGDFDVFQWGWYVEPDPDSILSYLTTSQFDGSSDSWYSNPEYDQLYAEQHVEMDKAKREAIVKHMQQILFQDSPYLVTAYSSIGEAVRSDRFACFEPQPDPGGIWLIQYGVQNYLNVRPADQAGDCDGIKNAVGATAAALDESAGKGVMIGIGVAAAALAVGGGFFLMRRRSSVGDRE